MSETLFKFVYSEYCNHYNKKQWIYNLPLWSELSEEDQKFWRDLISNIKVNYKEVDRLEQKIKEAK